MKLKFIFNEERDLAKVRQRFYAVADTFGISRDEALREALLFWLRMVPESSDFSLEISAAEWKDLAPAIALIRERHRSAGPASSSEGPVS